MSTKKTFVTQPYLPPLEEFIPYLEKIWESKILTNGGPYHQKLEEKLREILGVNHISLFNNGTIALVTALQALKISGEVITTPYSFVATTNALIWNNIKPVFVDIEAESFNIDPNKIEAAITPSTSAILAVHCYGNPCNVDAIEKIAKKYQLKVIYDSAHAFGVTDGKSSILNYGDLSIVSFHATKIFNTFEGGAIVCNSSSMKTHIDNLKNFGFLDEVTVVEPGINGKMSEINAAFGLSQLNHLEFIHHSRMNIANIYNHHLSKITGISIPKLNYSKYGNYSYYPILINSEYPISRDSLYNKLKENDILSRRYFYPLISNFEMYRNLPSASKSNLPVANKIADKILCLPIFPNLDFDTQIKVINLIKV